MCPYLLYLLYALLFLVLLLLVGCVIGLRFMRRLSKRLSGDAWKTMEELLAEGYLEVPTVAAVNVFYDCGELITRQKEELTEEALSEIREWGFSVLTTEHYEFRYQPFRSGRKRRLSKLSSWKHLWGEPSHA